MLEVSFERAPGASCFAALALAPGYLIFAPSALRWLPFSRITERDVQLHFQFEFAIHL